ncbi:response regulator [Bacillota bacterium Meth-B3]
MLKYRLAIVDDEYYIRQRLKKIINWTRLGVEPAGEAANGREAIGLLDAGVDLMVLDIKLPDMSGIDVARYAYERHLGTRIILLSGFNDFSYAQGGIRHGVVDYLLKPCEEGDLNRSIERAIQMLEQDLEQGRMLKLAGRGEAAPGDGATQPSLPSDVATSRKICRYIERHYAEPDLSVTGLAELFQMNISYLGSIFKKVNKLSIHQYITLVRMQRAAALIRSRGHKITDIAFLVGYSNIFYFSKRFKMVFGVSPKEYERACVEKALRDEETDDGE